MRGDTWVRDMVLREQQIWPTILEKKKTFCFPKLLNCNFLITLRCPRRRAVESALVDNYC
jgi:hypothetical protein